VIAQGIHVGATDLGGSRHPRRAPGSSMLCSAQAPARASLPARAVCDERGRGEG
jgi:hypothetical protein